MNNKKIKKLPGVSKPSNSMTLNDKHRLAVQVFLCLLLVRYMYDDAESMRITHRM